MLTLKTGVAAAILVGAVTATAGITYVTARASVTVSCPAAVSAAPPATRPDLPLGQLPALHQGKQF
jgi:hypothetical protein